MYTKQIQLDDPTDQSIFQSNLDVSEDDLIKLHLNESLPEVFSDTEEKELHEKSKTDQTAYNKFLRGNLRLVAYIAKKYKYRATPSFTYADMIQEGNIGLIKSIEKFDVSRYPNIRFSSYATWWIRQAITRALAEQSRNIRIPVHANTLLQKINKTVFPDNGETINSRKLSAEEIAQHLHQNDAENIKILLPFLGGIYSLDQEKYDDGEVSVVDTIGDTQYASPEAHGLNAELAKIIEHSLASLKSKNERLVLTKRFGLDGQGEYSLEETGLAFNVTRERVRQIEAKALSRLRRIPEIKDLKFLINANPY